MFVSQRVSRIFVACFVFAASVSAFAQTYPSRPVRLIVPFPPGGGNDILARAVGNRLTEIIGQQIVVDNRGGAGGVIGAQVAATALPDGYTLFLGSVGNLAQNPALKNDLPYNPVRDFAAVSLLATSSFILAVHPSVAAKSVKELIAFAKANPGKLNYASAGAGSSLHMAAEIFKYATGVDIVHVPYKGSSGARTDVLGGQVQMMFDAVPTMSEHAKTGRVTALGTTGKARSTVLPNVPTISEAGVTGYEAVIWLGLMAPRGTPPAIVNRLNAEIAKIQNRAEVSQEWASQGAAPMVMTPDEFGRYLDEDIVKWERIVKISGAKPDQ